MGAFWGAVGYWTKGVKASSDGRRLEKTTAFKYNHYRAPSTIYALLQRFCITRALSLVFPGAWNSLFFSNMASQIPLDGLGNEPRNI